MKKISVFIIMIFSMLMLTTLLLPLGEFDTTFAKQVTESSTESFDMELDHDEHDHYHEEQGAVYEAKTNKRPYINIVGFYSLQAKGFNATKTITSVDGVISNVTGVSAIYVENGAVFTMTGGTIKDCEAEKGAAVYVASGGTFIMEGGTISDCNSVYGGAVYIENGGNFTMSGGNIELNTSSQGGAVYVATGGEFVMTGGYIEDNSAEAGGGVYIEDGGSFELNGGNIIHCGYNEEFSVTAVSSDGYNKIAGVVQKEPRTENNRNHNYVIIEELSTASTCITNGVSHYRCTICKDEFDQTEQLGDHDWAEEQIEATCIEGAYIKYTCKVCGEIRNSDKGVALGHNTYEVSRTSLVCTGTDVVYGCTRCDYTYTQNLGDGTGHAYDQENIIESAEKTCTSDGYVLYTCKYCGVITQDVIKQGHVFVYVRTDATCTEDGSVVTQCTVCGYISSTETIPKLGHVFVNEKLTFTGNCLAKAEYTSTCSRCGDTNIRYGELGDHSFGTDYESLDATCTTAGYQKGTCTICGEYVTIELEALGHKYVYTVTEPATCTQKGSRVGVCSVCGDTVTEEIPSLGHVKSYNNYHVSAQPTCTELGMAILLCTRCGLVIPGENPIVLSTIEHSYNLIEEVASCTEYGYQTFECSVCYAHKTKVLAPLGHDYRVVSSVASTCTQKGVKYLVCYRCGQQNNEEIDINPNGHNWVSGVVEPTCEEDGYTGYHCSYCGKSSGKKEDIVPALGHNFVNWQCTRCGAMQLVEYGGVKYLAETYGNTIRWRVVGYTDEVPATLVIPSTYSSNVVYAIANGAFENCTKITKLTVNSNITIIDSNAFSGCSNLTSITLPSSLTTLGSKAFYGCPLAGTVTLPSTITAMGQDVFSLSSGYFKITSTSVKVMEMVAETCNAVCIKLEEGSITDLKKRLSNFVINVKITNQDGSINVVCITVNRTDITPTLSGSSSYIYSWAGKTITYVLSDTSIDVSLYGSVTINTSYYNFVSVTKSLTLQSSKNSNITTLLNLDAEVDSSISELTSSHAFTYNQTIEAGNIYSASLDFSYLISGKMVDYQTEDGYVLKADMENYTATITGYVGTLTTLSVPTSVQIASSNVVLNAINGNVFTATNTAMNITLPTSILTVSTNAFTASGSGYIKITTTSDTLLNTIKGSCVTLTLTSSGSVSVGEGASVVSPYIKVVNEQGLNITLNLNLTQTYVVEDCVVSVSLLGGANLTYADYYEFISVVKTLSITADLEGVNQALISIDSEEDSLATETAHSFDYTFDIASNNEYSVNMNFVYTTHGKTVEYTKDNYVYQVDMEQGTAKILSYTGTASSVTTPATLTLAAKTINVVAIEASAFANKTSITSLTISAGILSIGDSAFSGCTAITTVSFPSGLNTIGASAFASVNFSTAGNYGSITLPTSITSIGEGAFSCVRGFRINTSQSVIALLQEACNGVYVDQEYQFIVDTSFLTQYFDLSIKNSSSTEIYYNHLSLTSKQYIVTADYFICLPSSTSYKMTNTHYLELEPGDDLSGYTYLSRLVMSHNVKTNTTTLGTSSSVNTYFTSDEQSNTVTKSYSNIVNKSTLTLTYWLNYTTTFKEGTPCFVEGSLVTLADGSVKKIEDIGYDDLLLVWNFDTGRYDASYPMWITKRLEYFMYYRLTFDDGSVFNNIVAHRLFSLDDLYFVKSVDAARSQVGHNFFGVLTDENGNTIYDENGNIMFASKKLLSIDIIVEDVYYYNIITAYSMNVFVNSILASSGMNNLYGTMTADMTYDLEKMAERQAGGYGEDGTLYTLEELGLPEYWYYGLRLAEQKGVREIADIQVYVELDLDVMRPVDTTSVTLEDGNIIDKNLWIVSYSDEDVFSSNYVVNKVVEGSYVVLKTPEIQEGFIGWYCSSDGKIYGAGDSVQIFAGTHFIALYD